jgi:uncharacterized SAM-binding protein YcdF (DUF218 family)
MFMSRAHRKSQAPAPTPRDRENSLLSRRGRLRRIIRAALLTSFVCAGIVFGGFLWFADSVASMKPPQESKADAIIVLTGGYLRIDQAVELLRSGAGTRLLISGVNPSTTPAQIRKMTQSSAGLFSCCVDIGYEALDTIGNANEAASWIKDHDYQSVLVVTNNYHMRRSLHELRRVSPNTHFVAYPVVNADLTRKNWFADPDVLRTLLSEYIKFVAAGARDITGIGKTSGLRGEVSHVDQQTTASTP